MRFSILLAAAIAFFAGTAAAQPGPEGHYEGKMQVQGREVDVTVDLDRDAKKAWIGHITISPNPGEFPLNNISVEDRNISWTVPQLPGTPKFDGSWDPDAKVLKVTGHMGGMNLPIEFRRTAAARVYVPEPNSPLTKDFQGTWEGALDTGAQTLRLTLILEPDADGRATGTLISVDQGGVKLPVGQVTIRDGELEIAVKAVAGGYKGRMNPAKDQISGDWTQMGNTLPLNLKRQAAPKQ